MKSPDWKDIWHKLLRKQSPVKVKDNFEKKSRHWNHGFSHNWISRFRLTSHQSLETKTNTITFRDFHIPCFLVSPDNGYFWSDDQFSSGNGPTTFRGMAGS
jgi:hypothetical protein